MKEQQSEKRKKHKLHRLMQMGPMELFWRSGQNVIKYGERKKFGTKQVPVCDRVFNKRFSLLKADVLTLHLRMENPYCTTENAISIPGGYDYRTNERNWHGGFQTPDSWPMEFSGDMEEYSVCAGIGDARTNWELNRHYQFALLAKNYHATGEGTYLEQLTGLFDDWNRDNPFLWGIAWASPVDAAIRSGNWCVALGFLTGMEGTEDICRKLTNGIINITDYLTKHYSGYSPADSRLIAEMYAVLQAGILFDVEKWKHLAIKTMTAELSRQIFSDGVDREQSLHYQAFYMEAMALSMRLMKYNGIPVPDSWTVMLERMCRFVCACRGRKGETAGFGDDDGGKLLDLRCGEDPDGFYDYIAYVLALCSMLTGKNYTVPSNDSGFRETISWLFTENEQSEVFSFRRYEPPFFEHFPKGGMTFLRTADRKAFFAIDHGPLGLGKAAAHGHADALSFQLYADGCAILADPGTGLYYFGEEERNYFRRTRNHNTVCVEGKDQSEILGPFQWGRKAAVKLISCSRNNRSVLLEAEHDGYGIGVKRKFSFDGENVMTVTDTVTGQANALSRSRVNTAVFILGPWCNVSVHGSTVHIHGITGTEVLLHFREGAETIRQTKRRYMLSYGKCTETAAIEVEFSRRLVTAVTVK